MKKYFFVFLVSFATANIAQTTDFNKQEDGSINRWSLDIFAGQFTGVAPYTNGYFSGNQNKFFGKPEINYFGAATRYMISPKFGINFGLGYSTLQNDQNSSSLPFEMTSVRLNVQGVVNAMRLFDIQESMGRFGLLFHGGMDGTMNTPQLGVNKGNTDSNLGFIVGVTPQYHISNKIAVFVDIAGVKPIQQDLNWDGGAAIGNQRLASLIYTWSLGLSISLGKSNMHGDWATIPTKSVDLKPIEDRLNKMESMIIDTDKDGLTDYLDVEKNSALGALVDAKGRMIDRDRNGIADELERYLDGKGGTTASAPETTDMVAKFVNDGYVAAYFDYDEAYPTQISLQSISLLTRYMKNNLNQNISILGYADPNGDVNRNRELSLKRAEIVKSLLIKAGTAASRLNVVPIDEADSVYNKSAVARSDARRITFKIE